jgi:hypothetical protein
MYAASFNEFCVSNPDAIAGELARCSRGAVDPTQLAAWLQQTRLLQALTLPSELAADARIYFEYEIPRLGRRADVILLVGHVLCVLEFKVGARAFADDALDQVWDYALDLKHFHEASHAVAIVPVMVATAAPVQSIDLQQTIHDDKLARPVRCNGMQICEAVMQALAFFNAPPIDADVWERGRYLPTPTIVEAARALYAGHHVSEISRNDAGARNLAVTSQTVERIIANARTRQRKAICFVTGVPGAGKTLVGLDVANRHLDSDSQTYSVFLSGNGPLVAVMREALTRDKVAQERQAGRKLTKGEARQGVEAFIQNVHHFRDDCLADPAAPPEHVVLFDEAQRAWDRAQTNDFMRRKRHLAGFDQTEPEFLIACLDRHPDWAVVVCLVGGGQEINRGEAGIGAWLDAVLRRFDTWDVYVSSRLDESEYHCEALLAQVQQRAHTHTDTELHLGTSMRSFRAESLSRFVRELLDLEVDAARATLNGLEGRYPIRLTRRLDRAKQWLREHARGSERYGMVVSAHAERLKPLAIDVRVASNPVKWFLDGKNDVRSSYYLEEVATEFDVQGLELDWSCVVWDGDLRYADGEWSHHEFRGTRWNSVRQEWRKRYLENAYRVLMTRARQGMVLVVPEGDSQDPTRCSEFYDPTYAYLRDLGLRDL